MTAAHTVNRPISSLFSDKIIDVYKRQPLVFSCEEENTTSSYLTDNEKAVAEWVLKNNKHAGATTQTLSNAKCLYLAIRVNNSVYGVVGISAGLQPLDASENNILLSILGECALALENKKIAKEKEEAAVLVKNEQLLSLIHI